MKKQGKTNQQIEDSENFTSVAVIGGILTLLGIFLVELFF